MSAVVIATSRRIDLATGETTDLPTHAAGTMSGRQPGGDDARLGATVFIGKPDPGRHGARERLAALFLNDQGESPRHFGPTRDCLGCGGAGRLGHYDCSRDGATIGSWGGSDGGRWLWRYSFTWAELRQARLADQLVMAL